MAQVGVLTGSAPIETVMMAQPESVLSAAKIPAPVVKENVQTHVPQQQHYTEAERDAVLKQLNKTLDAFDTHVSLSVDEKSHRTVIKVIDTESGKVLRQIPSEQLVRISERITELLGVIYDKKM
jgi:flagellar protein FlaG